MSGGDFARIAGTVDELAFQTKLLALNAAFEAARSQEQGRSLARLAIEMSRLVDRSTRAVRDIRSSFGKRRGKRTSRRPAAPGDSAAGGRTQQAQSPESAQGETYSGPDRRRRGYAGPERRRGGRPWSASGKKRKRRGPGAKRPPGGKDTDDPGE